MTEKIDTIFFDLGYTLINFRGNVNWVLNTSYFSLAKSLIKSGCKINARKFARQYQQIISRYYEDRELNQVEQHASIFVNRALARVGHAPASPEIVYRAIAAMYEVTESHWHLEKDTHATLAELKQKDYRLCIISNASNTEDLNNLVDNANLRQYFDHIIISAEERIRKPDRRIYEKALAVMQSTPAESLMVGDTLTADVLGAQKVGIRAAWITRRARRPDNSRVKKEIKPDFEISELSDLLKLLNTL